jgi:hypothetical protein
MVLLAVVSFLVGVGAATLWFQVAAKRNAANPAFQANGQPAAPSGNAAAPAPPVVETPRSASPATMAEVKQALPNYASLTVEQGTEILRQAALKEFASAAKEMEIQVAKAEAGLSAAENSKSAADQQAAMQHLRQIQAEQTAKLQQIAAHLQLQIAALKQLNAATNGAR